MKNHRTDVLVIGGGNAGMCAAITARMAGARVTVLESGGINERGGNTRHTRNLRVAHQQPLATLQDPYPADAYWQDLLRVTKGQTNEHLAKLMIERSAELLDWLQTQGVRFQPALTGTLNLAHSNAFFLGGGKSLLNAQYLAAEALGIDVHYQTPVEQLVIEDGVFIAAESVASGTRWQADALVVASGGFQSNEAWMRKVWGARADNFLIRGTPNNKGRMLAELIRAGAQTIGDPTQCHAVAIDARAPKYDGGIVSRLDCVCFSVVVNNQGLRFYDEGEDFWPKRYAIWGRLVADQPDQIAYAIVDSKVVNNYMPSLYPPLQAQTVAELAVLLDINSEALCTTLADFNAAVVGGEYNPHVLDGCTTARLAIPKSNWAQTIDQPPYYAYPLRPGITFTYMGVRVNESARVGFIVDDDQAGGRNNQCLEKHGEGTVATSTETEIAWSKNIFAAGEIMAGNILGQGYCAGIGMTIGGVFGRIAGEQATCL